jgi:hypothetical protein
VTALVTLLRAALGAPIGLLLIGLVAVLLAWGQYGRMEWLRHFDPGWLGIGGTRTGLPGSQWFAIPWGQDLVGFAGGVALLVALPSVFVRFVLRRPLADFGLALPRGPQLRDAGVQGFIIVMIAAPGFYQASSIDSIARFYPYYWGDAASASFAAFEAATFLFYTALECFFRGFVLFAIYQWIRDLKPATGAWDDGAAAAAATVISIIPYACWHLGKPPPEMWGTIVWGLIAGAAVLSTRTVWHVVIVHWLLNVLMDYCVVLRHVAPP